MTAAAENLAYLTQTEETIKLAVNDPIRLAQGRKYYERLSRSKNQDWIKRYVDALFGDDPSGTAVFRESFRSTFHIADEVFPVSGHPLLVGQDFGRDPGSVICQLDHKGRLLVLEEVAAEDIGLQQHLNIGLRPALSNPRYLGRQIILIGDPAGMQRSTMYEETSFDLIKRAGFMAYPGPTNDIDARLRAVEHFLLSQRDGGPAMVFDRQRCPTLVRAMSGGYRYARMKSGQRKPKPDKNQYSHLADALQYACTAAHGGMSNMFGRMLNRTAVARPSVPAGGWT